MAKTRPNTSWIGHTIGGRYKVEALLGHGGMSTVYKANDPNLQRTVAVKLIHPHLSNDAEFVRRFEQEAAAVAQLRHPNIIQVYDFNHDDDLYYMVLEYVPGDTLREKLKSLTTANRRLPTDEAIHIMATICDAVGYAHERGMIHRDLKPPNVMLTPKGEPILMDFGVAKMMSGTQHTATGAIIGTAKYMSPEQARGKHPDERSDIYSLGVMMFEMVTGQAPFEADTTVAVLMKHVSEPVPDIRQIEANTPEALVSVIGKALAKNPDERYQTAYDMARDLKAVPLPAEEFGATILQTGPVRERTGTEPSLRPSTLSTSSKKAGLPVMWIAGAAALVLILILGIGAFAFFSGGTDDTNAQGGEQGSGGSEADPNLPSSAGMVSIAEGLYTIGVDPGDRDHAEARQIELNTFWIDQHEITNAEYAEFLAGTDGQPPEGWPEDGKIPADLEQHPVKGVTWDMAVAYCTWAKKRLPTEAEWEVAARGPEQRLFPWGDDQQAVKLPRSGTYPVGTKPTNQSSFGVFDMAGNVWEWVDEPYAPLQNESNKVLRGGANDFIKDMAFRLQGDPTIPTMYASAGFRCAADKVNVVPSDNALEAGVFFRDTFDDPGGGWPILVEEDAFFGYHPPDFYHVEVSEPDDFTSISRPPDFDNVSVETEVLVDHTVSEDGDFRYGLALRRNGADQYYAFTISPRSGVWAVLKRTPAGLETLDEGPITSLKGIAPLGSTPTERDKLRVDASGSTFVFSINGQAVSEVSDSEYPSGEVGFYVETFDEPLAHIHYDLLTIREVELNQIEATPDENIVLSDSFDNPESGWPVIAGDDSLFGYHPPDFYHVEVSAPDKAVSVSHQPDLDDATVETEVLVDHTVSEDGDFRYGLALRRTGDEQYYAFTISSRRGAWYVLKQTPAGLEVLDEGTIAGLKGIAPSGSTPDTPDILRVDASGSTFVFHINGEVVSQIDDSDYPSGQVGFYVETFDEPLAHIHYDLLTIRELDPSAISQLPADTAETAVETPASASDTLIPTEEIETATSTPEPEAVPTDTPEVPTPTATPEPEDTATAPPASPSDQPSGMVLIPTGGFLMGSANGQPNEQPEHQVFLDAYYLDRYEVSNAQYRECVDAGGCTQANKADSFTYSGYRDDPAYDNYPVVNVTWDQASAYCQWAGKRLPTEAEWEFAAGGPENLTWPWGNTFDASLSAAGAPDLQPVDSYSEGGSSFGVYNMAGNAAEWVQDVFNENFYASSPERNPVSSGSGDGRIYRGGSFGNPDGTFYTTSRRYGNIRSFSDVDVGFRCAADVN